MVKLNTDFEMIADLAGHRVAIGKDGKIQEKDIKLTTEDRIKAEDQRRLRQIKNPVENVVINGQTYSFTADQVKEGVEIDGVRIKGSVVRNCELLPGSAIENSIVVGVKGQVRANASEITDSESPYIDATASSIVNVITPNPIIARSMTFGGIYRPALEDPRTGLDKGTTVFEAPINFDGSDTDGKVVGNNIKSAKELRDIPCNVAENEKIKQEARQVAAKATADYATRMDFAVPAANRAQIRARLLDVNVPAHAIDEIMGVLERGLHDAQDHWFYSRLTRLLRVDDARQPEEGPKTYYFRAELSKNDGELQRLINSLTPVYEFDKDETLDNRSRNLKPESADLLSEMILLGQKVGINTAKALEELGKKKDPEENTPIEVYARLRQAVIDKVQAENWDARAEDVADDILSDCFEFFCDTAATRLTPVRGADNQRQLVADPIYQRGFEQEVVDQIRGTLEKGDEENPLRDQILEVINSEKAKLVEKGFDMYQDTEPELNMFTMELPDGRNVITKLEYRPFGAVKCDQGTLQYDASVEAREAVAKALEKIFAEMGIGAKKPKGDYGILPVAAGSRSVDLNILLKGERIQKDRAIGYQRDLGHTQVYYFDNEALAGNGWAVTKMRQQMERGVALRNLWRFVREQIFRSRPKPGFGLHVFAVDPKDKRTAKVMKSLVGVTQLGNKWDGTRSYLVGRITQLKDKQLHPNFAPPAPGLLAGARRAIVRITPRIFGIIPIIALPAVFAGAYKEGMTPQEKIIATAVLVVVLGVIAAGAYLISRARTRQAIIDVRLRINQAIAHVIRRLQLLSLRNRVISENIESGIVRYDWGGRGNAVLLGLPGNIAEIWHYFTIPTGDKKVPNTIKNTAIDVGRGNARVELPEITLKELLEAHPEMVGRRFRRKPYFTKTLSPRRKSLKTEKPFVIIGFKPGIEEPEKFDNFIAAAKKERELIKELIKMLNAAGISEDDFNDIFKLEYNKWLDEQYKKNWQSADVAVPHVADIPGIDIEAFAALMERIRKNRELLMGYVHKVEQGDGVVVIAPAGDKRGGYPHNIVGSWQLHIGEVPEEASVDEGPKHEAWITYYVGNDSDGKPMYVSFEIMNMSDITYSPIDFDSPLKYADGKVAPRKDLRKKLELISQTVPQTEEEAIEIMIRMLRPMGFDESTFNITNRRTPVTERYEAERAEVVSCIEGAYPPVQEYDLWTVHEITLDGKGSADKARVVVNRKDAKTDFEEILVVNGEVTVKIAGEKDIHLSQGKALFIPANKRGRYTIESDGKARVVRSYPGKDLAKLEAKLYAAAGLEDTARPQKTPILLHIFSFIVLVIRLAFDGTIGRLMRLIRRMALVATPRAPAARASILLPVPRSIDRSTRMAIEDAIERSSIPEKVILEPVRDPEDIKDVRGIAEKKKADLFPITDGLIQALSKIESHEDKVRIIRDLLEYISLELYTLREQDILKTVPDRVKVAKLRQISLRLNRDLPLYTMDLLNASLANLAIEQAQRRKVRSTPLPDDTREILRKAKAPRDIMVRFDSSSAYKKFIERFRQHMLSINPNFFEEGMPVRLHVQIVPCEEERSLLNATPEQILQSTHSSDVVTNLVIMDKEEANKLTVEDMCNMYRIDQKEVRNFALIGQSFEGQNIELTDDKTIVIESHLGITPTLCDIALRLLANPDDPRMPDGVDMEKSEGAYWYRVKSLPDADTAQIHDERERYYRAIKKAVDF